MEATPCSENCWRSGAKAHWLVSGIRWVRRSRKAIPGPLSLLGLSLAPRGGSQRGPPALAITTNWSPSSVRTAPSTAPQSRTARCTMASITAARSAGDEAMTRRMSAVAVCSCRRSCSSANSRVFSIAITAWSAKVSMSAISRSVKGRTS